MAPPSDPWDWSVDDVVEQFCRQRSLLDRRPNARFPDPSTFEQVIRENDIDGSTLLLDVDKAAVKELGITKLGELSAIQYAVELLRRRSPQFQSHVRNDRPQPTNPMHSGGRTPATLLGQEDVNGYFPSTPAPIVENPLKRQPSEELTQKQSACAQYGIADNELPNDNLRAKETYVEDSSGRKRRRLDLQSSLQPTQRSPGYKDPVASTLLQVTPYKLPSRAQICGSDTRGRFLARNKLLVDEIFFGQTRFGQELNMDVDTRIIQDGRKHQDHVEVLPFNQINIEGHQNYVYRQILHLFNGTTPTQVKYDQQQAQVITPYRSNLVTKDRSPSHILLNLSEHPLRALRIDDSDLYVRSGYDNTDYEDWDFMRRSSKDQDMILPAYGESNFDEQEYESSFIEEFECEEVGDAARKRMLTKTAVLEIIDKRIDDYVQDWSERKLPLREATAWRLWKQGKSIKDRLSLAKTAEKQVQALTRRLEKLCTDIAAHQWSKDDDIRRQCASLEETVINREEQRFKAKIWQSKEAPHRPASVPRIRKKRPASVHASDEDGILLSSESDIPSDDLSNFIEYNENHSKAKRPVGSPSAFGLSLDGGVGGRKIDGEDLSPGVDAVEGASDMELDPPERAGFETSDTPTQKPVPKQPLDNVIDLTHSTSDSDESPLIGENKAEISTKPSSDRISCQVGKNPETEPDDAVLLWSSQDLENKQDRKRLLVKLLRTLPQVEYDKLRDYMGDDVSQKALRDDIYLAIRAFVFGKQRVPGFTEQESECATKTAILFACWYYCSSHYSGMKMLPTDVANDMFRKLSNKKRELILFCQFVRKIFRTHLFPVKPHIDLESDEGCSVSGEELSDNEIKEASQSSSHKRRKRVVEESQAAKDKRAKAKEHQESQEQRAKLVLQKLDSGLIETGDGVVINPGKSDDHDFILLNPHIAVRIHNHQVEGLRFLWREIVTGSSDKANMQGALLSHTMGLGKTMQTISLLVTIAEAAASDNSRISSQIPPSLQQSRTLIICPSALIANWLDEFAKWLPENASHLLGDLFSIDSESVSENRLKRIARWYKNGGILLVSYDLFRSYVTNNKTVKLTPETREVVKEQLLGGPRIVIADEAHKLKNPNSEIGKAASLFKTLSRVALTGSPLSNNLEEYFAMINWIAPGYLGDRIEFKANFEEPIREGGYVDSTPSERRKAIKKLKVLEDVTGPKIHRREVTVLRGSLKPKTEFVITVPLTEIQAEIYHAYVKRLKVESDTHVSSARIFDWLAMLSLLCNHPFAFQTKLSARKNQLTQKKPKVSAGKPSQSPVCVKKTRTAATTNPSAQESTDSNVTTPREQDYLVDNDTDNEQDVSESDVSLSIINELEQILKKIEHNVKNSKHSYRTKLLMQILNKSKEAGDSVLVFSQSISTLDFLEDLFRQENRKFIRLDGKTKMSERATYLKSFNKGSFDIFLISTRAGGLGFNLPRANRVVIFDFSFNPQWEEQAIGRAYRIGQKKPVFVYRFIAGGTFEEKLFNQAVFKTQLAFKVVEKKNTKNFAQRKMDYLFKPKTVPQEGLDEHKGKDAVLDEILDELAAKGPEECYIRKIIAAETLQDPADEILTAEDQQEIQQMIADEQLKKENPAAWKAKQNILMTAQALVPQPAPGDITLNSHWSHRTSAALSRLPLSTAPVAPMANMMPTRDGTVGVSAPFSQTSRVVPTFTQPPSQVQKVNFGYPQPSTEIEFGIPEQNTKAVQLRPGELIDTDKHAQSEKFNQLSKLHTVVARCDPQEINGEAGSEQISRNRPKPSSELLSSPSPINQPNEGLSANSERLTSLPPFEDLIFKRN